MILFKYKILIMSFNVEDNNDDLNFFIAKCKLTFLYRSKKTNCTERR